MTTLLLSFLTASVAGLTINYFLQLGKWRRADEGIDTIYTRLDLHDSSLAVVANKLNASIDQYNTNYSNITGCIQSLDKAQVDLDGRLVAICNSVARLTAKLAKKRQPKPLNAPITTIVAKIKNPKIQPLPQVKDAPKKRKEPKNSQSKHKDRNGSRKTTKASGSHSVKRSTQVQA